MDEGLQFYGVAEVMGDVGPDEVGADRGIEGSVGDLTGDPGGHGPLRGPRVSGRVEEQSQLLQHLVEERRSLGLFAPEETGQHGKGGTLDPGDQRVQPCLDEPVRPDMPPECPLVCDVAELLESVVAGHHGLLGRPSGRRRLADFSDDAAIEFLLRVR
ncbi:hypothetical protein [Streptomyces xanthophaeus]